MNVYASWSWWRRNGLLAIGIGSSSWLMAQSHPTPDMLDAYLRDGSLAQRSAFMQSLGTHRAHSSLLDRARHRLQQRYLQHIGASDQLAAMAPPPAWRGMPTTGNVKMLTLLIDFNDQPHVTPKAEVESKVFGGGSGNYPYESLTNYYQRSSYGLLNLGGNVLGWYRPASNRSSVPMTDAGREALIMEALAAFDGMGHDFSQYDNNGDGKIDYFSVVWTGPHTGWGSFWWGYQTGWYVNSSYRLDGKALDTYSWQWERYNASDPNERFSPLTLIHETGHALGLPDYYDYNSATGPKGGVGGLDMMDSTKGDHNAFSKFLLDWTSPTIVTSSAIDATLRPASQYPDSVIMMPTAPTSGFGEFYMVEYRRRLLNDTGIPADGLLIWHVDSRLGSNGDYLYDNSYTAHKLLRLMEADGLEEIEQNRSANSGDFYVNGNVFGPSTTPNSNRYDGTQTQMEVSDIGITASTATFTIVTVNPADTENPTVSASVSGTSGTIMLQASAQDNVGVSSVAFFVDGSQVGTDATSPYTWSLNSQTLANGSHTLLAKAYDGAGHEGVSSAVSFSVMNAGGGTGGGSERVRNGDFESRASGWSGSTNRIRAWGAEPSAFSGRYCAWLGGQGKWTVKSRKKKKYKQELAQTVTLPAAAASVTLSFALQITTAETEAKSYDFLKVELVDAKKHKVLRTLGTYSNLGQGGGYQVKTFDATAFRGRKVQIRFTMREDAKFRTNFVIDGVSLKAQ